jgi:hypothetical protein
MRDNPVRHRLDAGEVVLGTMVTEFATPAVARLTAAAGAEFTLFDLEHSGYGIDRMRTVLAAARSADTVPFLRVPDEGSSTLEAVEHELRALTIDDCGLDRRPFLEVSVQLFTAEPDLRRRIDEALATKPVRLLRVERQRLGGDGLLADVVPTKSDLLELKFSDVFRRLHQHQYHADPDEELLALFDEVVAAALEPAPEEEGLA